MRLKQCRAMFVTHGRCIVQDRGEHMPDVHHKEVAALVKIAQEQGWTVEVSAGGSNGGKLCWRNPDGEGQTFTATRVGNGRDLKNLKARLQRAGLILHTTIDLTDKEPEVTTYREVLEDPSKLKGMSNKDLEKMVKTTDKNSAEFAVGTVLVTFTDLIQAAVSALGLDMSQILMKHTKDSALEDQALEAMQSLDQANARIAKLEASLSKLGAEYQQAASDLAFQTDRANKAEQKLKAFRAALADD